MELKSRRCANGSHSQYWDDDPEAARILEEWTSHAEDHNVSTFYAAWTVISWSEMFACYGCLLLRHFRNFDVYQIKTPPWTVYEPPAWEAFMPQTSAQRLCFQCRLNTDTARKYGLGWLYSHKSQQCDDDDDDDDCYYLRNPYYSDPHYRDLHIRCSRCLTLDSITDCRIERSNGKVVKEGDDLVCRRLLQGNLCRKCFKKDNTQWQAYKSRIKAEVEAKTRYLEWMEAKDHSRNPTERPVADSVEVCQSTEEGDLPLRKHRTRWNGKRWDLPEQGDNFEDAVSDSDEYEDNRSQWSVSPSDQYRPEMDESDGDL